MNYLDFHSDLTAVDLLEKFGDVGQYLIPVATAGCALLSGHAVQAIALGILGCAQAFEFPYLKEHFPRDRPQPYRPGWVSPEDKESFPSSHTGGAFLAVGFTVGLYGVTSPMTITTLVLASLVGTSRYLSKKHWGSDVVVGALIGTVNGFIAANCKFLLCKILIFI